VSDWFATRTAAPAANGGLDLVMPGPRNHDEAIAAAVATARDANVAAVGLTEEQETEAADKTTLHLPGAQDRLVEAVAAAAPRTVGVVNAATPVIMPWRDRVDAILWAGLPGQEGGHAVAAALLGDIEPAGRLVTTFPTGDGQAPAWSVTPVDGQLRYAEGTFIGHRGHFAGRAPAAGRWDTLAPGGRLLLARGLGDIRASIDLDRTDDRFSASALLSGVEPSRTTG
jgi:beta-glucosidase